MLPMDLPGYHIRAVQATEQCVVVTVECLGDEQVCPDCHQASRHLHSCYVRHLRDLPVQGRQTQITAHIRRFRCLNQACARKTFSEPLEGLAQRYAQRTDRMTATLLQLILSVSSTVGALLAWALGMEVSARTLLRVVDHGEWQAPTPRVLGVDDFAFRRGSEYGTLLCDLERGKPIDLLLGRSKEALLQWLKAHPGVKIIVRDRASSYADAAREGAPDAIQVADRFHLVRNVGDALKEVVDEQSWALPEPAPPPVSAPEPPSAPPVAPDTVTARRVTRAEQRRAAAADRLRRRYETVQLLHRSGRSIAQIRRETGLSRHTIRKYLASATVPKRAERRRVPSKLDPFVDYLGERWEAGCRNAKALYQEIITQGYAGSIQSVRRLLQPWRAQCPPPPRPQRPGPSRKEVHPAPRVTWKEMRWAVLRPPEHVDDTQRPLLQDFLSLHPALAQAYELAQRFHRLLREHDVAALDAWLTEAAQSGLPPFVRLARTLQADRAAVEAGIELPWNTGPVEGQITRLKLVKRIGYGRASLPLLRARIVGCA